MKDLLSKVLTHITIEQIITHVEAFISGLGLGSIFTYFVKKRIDRHSKLIDSRDTLLTERYEKLYTPLQFTIMDTFIVSGGPLAFKLKMRMIIEFLFAKEWKTAWHLFRRKDTRKVEYELDLNSSFPLEGVKKHIKKYSKLADGKLIDLLENANKAEIELAYSNISANLGNISSPEITSESVELVHYIRSQYILLGKQLNH